MFMAISGGLVMHEHRDTTGIAHITLLPASSMLIREWCFGRDCSNGFKLHSNDRKRGTLVARVF